MNIKEYLGNLGIEFTTHTHPAVFTCEEAEEHYKEIKGVHAKNLFLCDKKKKNFYLVVLPFEKNIDFEKYRESTGKRLSFAKEEYLKDILNVTPGSVSPFTLINDTENKVMLLIDKKVWDGELVAFHPNINTETLELTGEDFHKYVESLENKCEVI